MFSSSHERAIRICLTAIAASSLLALAGIVIFLFTEGLPLFRHVSPLDFLLGDLWYPTEDPGLFGIFPLLVGSVAVTVLSSLLAVPLGVMTAVYLAEIAPPFARRVIKPFVELLAALPSVVLGFLGMVVLAPILQDVLGAATGLNLLNASLVLAIMSLPTICSVSEDALRAVPRSLREASLALGATRWETIVRVVVPAALSGTWGVAIINGSYQNRDKAGRPGGKPTRFQRLSASGNMQGGVARSSNIFYQDAEMRVRGGGRIDFNNEDLDCNLFVKTDRMQEFPVRVTGKLHDPKTSVSAGTAILYAVTSLTHGIFELLGGVMEGTWNLFR